MTINERAQDILNLINPIIKKNQNSSLEFPVTFTYNHVLERVQTNLESINLLIKNGITKHDHAIGLLSRNILSDFITTGYIIRLSTSEDEHYEKLYSLYDSDLKKADSFIAMFKNAGYINDESFEIYNRRYSDENHIYKVIRDYKKEFLTKDFPAIKRIIELFLQSDLKDFWVNQIKKSYDIWTMLSKYEHIGWNSYDTTREIKEADAILRLEVVLLNTLIMVAGCLEILKEDNSFKTAIDLIKKYN